jgi:hypothetical protein
VAAGTSLEERRGQDRRWQDPAGRGLRPGVDPDRDRSDDYEREITLGANWFFNGHRNKITFDVSRVGRKLAPETDTSNRVRLQWDWSF